MQNISALEEGLWGKKKTGPWWKRPVEGDIKELRREINLLERAKKKELGVRRKRGLVELHGNYII